MKMLRLTPEQHESYKKRMARKPTTEVVGNCELVKLGVCAVNQPAPVSSPTALSSSAAPLCLPWPPKTGNTAYRTTTNKATGKVIHYLDSAVKAYRQSVAVLLGRTDRISGIYELHMDMSPPDARTRDIDNALKIVLDSLKGVWLPDDSMAYMRKLVVAVNDTRRGEVVIRALTDRDAA